MPRAEWSGWAQAIGALIALAVAIGTTRSQIRHSRRVFQEAEAGKLEARAELIAQFLEGVEGYLTGLLGPTLHEALRLAHNRTRYVNAAFAKIDLHTCSNPVEISALTEALERMQRISEATNYALEVAMTADMVAMVREHADGLKDLHDRLMTEGARLRSM